MQCTSEGCNSLSSHSTRHISQVLLPVQSVEVATRGAERGGGGGGGVHARSV